MARNFDINEALTVEEFYESHEVAPEEQDYFIKDDCKNSETGATFAAVGFTNGETYEKDGEEHPAMTFFALSKELTKKGYVLNDDFLAEHTDQIRLLHDGEDKPGVLFLAGEGRKKWADLKRK